jgi:hypothetical protein
MTRKLRNKLATADAHVLLTLTCNPQPGDTYSTAFFRMSLAIPSLFKRLRRHAPLAAFEYFLVWETTAAGWPHAHLILRAPYVPQTLLSRIWSELTGAPIVDVRLIHGANAITNYVCKYLAKNTAAPSGAKHYRCSRRFFANLLALPPPLDHPRLSWHVEPGSVEEVAHRWAKEGFTCTQDNQGTVRAYPRGHPDAPLFDCFGLWASTPRRSTPSASRAS